jgi:hypothetical protein
MLRRPLNQKSFLQEKDLWSFIVDLLKELYIF